MNELVVRATQLKHVDWGIVKADLKAPTGCTAQIMEFLRSMLEFVDDAFGHIPKAILLISKLFDQFQEGYLVTLSTAIEVLTSSEGSRMVREL